MDAFKQGRTITTVSLAAWFVMGGNLAWAGSLPNTSVLDPYTAAPASSGKLNPILQDPSGVGSTTYVTVPMDGGAAKPVKEKKAAVAKGTKPSEAKSSGGVVGNTKAAGSKIVDSSKAAGSKIVDGSKAASNKLVDGSKAASSKIVSGSKQLGDGMANGTKKIGDGISSGAKASGNMFMKGAKALGEGVKTTGQKLKDGSQAVGDKITSVPKMITGGGKKPASNAKPELAANGKSAKSDHNSLKTASEPAQIAPDAAKAAAIEPAKTAAPVQTATKDKGVIGKTLGIVPKMPKIPFIGGKKTATPQTASAPSTPAAGVDQ